MTRIAITSSTPSPCCDDWKACAVPWKLVATVAGNVCRASRLISLTALPSETPGFRLKEMFTEGSCPRWFTDRGPRVLLSVATELSGTS